MILAIIQVLGVGIASTYGMNIIMRTHAKNEVTLHAFIAFGIGMMMAFSGLFFK